MTALDLAVFCHLCNTRPCIWACRAGVALCMMVLCVSTVRLATVSFPLAIGAWDLFSARLYLRVQDLFGPFWSEMSKKLDCVSFIFLWLGGLPLYNTILTHQVFFWRVRSLITESARKWANERTFGPKNLSTFPYKRPTNTLEPPELLTYSM